MQQEKYQEKQSPKISINLSSDGSLKFEGELNKENAEHLEKLLLSAEYFQSKAKQLESEKIESDRQIDAVVVVFVACLFLLTAFLAYIGVSSLSKFFNNKPQNVSQKQEIVSNA